MQQSNRLRKALNSLLSRRERLAVLGLVIIFLPLLYSTCIKDTGNVSNEHNIFNEHSVSNEHNGSSTTSTTRTEIQDEFKHIYSEKWIVVTTVQYPTSAVKRLAAEPGYKVVIVADTKTPNDWQWENCTFLSVEIQKHLGYEIHDILPYKHYGRKNIGYLFAIQHGAKTIYETDDDNELLPGFDLTNAFRDPENRLYEYATPNTQSDSAVAINIYAHFGQPSVWPRGFPLNQISRAPESGYVESAADIPVRQGLANGDPDVDAIFRLTRKQAGYKIDITFDANAPPVAIPKNSFAPYNSQNTLHNYNAFFGLLIPITTTFRVCDIWRGYWAQRLLWEIDSRLSFFKASVLQDRNEHDYLLDYLDEKPLYEDTPKLLDFLRNWSSDADMLSDRLISLTTNMAKEGFWKDLEILLAKAWVNDLRRIGYEFPAVRRQEALSEEGTTQLQLVPWWKQPVIAEVDTTLRFPVTGVSLIMSFNLPQHYHNIDLVKKEYGKEFDQMVFCGPPGPNADEVRTRTDLAEGWRQYRCMLAILNASDVVPESGYMMSHDDVLMNTRLMANLPRDKFWTGSISTIRNVNEWHWPQPSAYSACRRVLRRLFDDALRPVYRETIVRITNNTAPTDDEMGMKCCQRGLQDWYYVPKQGAKDFADLLQVFSEDSDGQGTLMEIAVPTTLWLLRQAGLHDYVEVKSHSLWGNDRTHWESYVAPDVAFVHPVKLSDPWTTRKAHYLRQAVNH